MDDRSEQKLGYPRQRVEGVDDQALGKGQVLAEQQHFVAQQILHPLRVARAPHLNLVADHGRRLVQNVVTGIRDLQANVDVTVRGVILHIEAAN